jgi:hypothetical protein
MDRICQERARETEAVAFKLRRKKWGVFARMGMLSSQRVAVKTYRRRDSMLSYPRRDIQPR